MSINIIESYNIKCIGCGATLHNDPSKIGFVQNYTKDKTKYCKRCFNLKYYQKLDNSCLDVGLVNQNVQNISFTTKTCIFHVLDVLNLDNSLNLDLVNTDCLLYFVVNKMDCLPKKYNSTVTNDYINKTLQAYGFTNYELVYTSVNNKSSIKRLYNIINSVSKKKYKTIFIGNTNVGKSSLINALSKQNDIVDTLTVSPFVNTTIDFKKVKINKNEIVDSPGIVSTTNITNYLTPNNVKKVMNFKNNTPKSYFIANEQALIIEGLAAIYFLTGTKSTFTFYISNEVNIERCKLVNATKNLSNAIKDPNKINYYQNLDWQEHLFNLDPTKKHNFSIDGLGLISLNKGIETIKIVLPKEIKVSLNKYAII